MHNREGGRKENKQTRTLVSSKRKKGEVCNTFLAFCASVSYRERVFERNSLKATGTSALFCWLPFSVLLSSSSGLICDIPRKPFVWVLRQKKGSSDWHLHPHPLKRMPRIVSQLSLNVKQFYLTAIYQSNSATSPGQSGPGGNGNEGVACVPQSSIITECNQMICSIELLEIELFHHLTVCKERTNVSLNFSVI